MASNKRSNSSKKTLSARERRLRQVLAYFIYYWGGVIDLENAINLCSIADQIEIGSDLMPTFKSDFEWKEVDQLISLVRMVQKLGTTADIGTTPQFAYLGNDKLACKELPKDFYESFFSPKDKLKLNWALVAHDIICDDKVLRKLRDFRSLLPSDEKLNSPAKPWEGFDPLTAEEEAERLRKERMATLPKFTPIPEPN